MPIVLAASCMPCPNAMAVAETAWARRNRRLSTPGWPWRKAHKTASIIRYPSRNPTSGETTIGIATFSPKPAQWTLLPAASRVAPTRPPSSAWVEEDGRPKYQVIRFQAMAPITPAKTTDRLARPTGRVTRSLPTVSATPLPKYEPTKLPKAATISAMRGVGDMFEGVAGGLQLVGNLLHLEYGQRVVLAGEQAHQQHPVRPVALVLQLVAADPVLLEVAHGAQPVHPLDGQPGLLVEHVDHLVHLAGQCRQARHAVQVQQAADRLEVVHHVVELRAEPVDVLPVERRDEGTVDLVEHLVGDGVAVVLDLDQPLADRLHVHPGHGELGEQLGALDQVRGGAGEEAVEGTVGGAELESHGVTLVVALCLSDRLPEC